MKIAASEYEIMRSWVAHMAPKVFSEVPLTPETHPVAVLDRIAAKSPANARAGLAIGIGDMVDFTLEWTTQDIAQCNVELANLGLPTLSEMQLRFARSIQRVIKRGAIKNEQEYYAVRNAAEQPTSHTILLWKLLEAYEASTSD
jgi:hypothetical protein